MNADVQAFATGFPLTLLHAAITVGLLALGAGVYALLTPYRDIQLIREGNTAAAISLGAVLVGLAIPLAVSLGYSQGEFEMVLWGGAIILVQLVVFRFTDFVLQGLPNASRPANRGRNLPRRHQARHRLILAAAVAGVPLPAGGG
jgi:putative membrane protein